MSSKKHLYTLFIKAPISENFVVPFLKICRWELVRITNLSFHELNSLSCCIQRRPFLVIVSERASSDLKSTWKVKKYKDMISFTINNMSRKILYFLDFLQLKPFVFNITFTCTCDFQRFSWWFHFHFLLAHLSDRPGLDSRPPGSWNRHGDPGPRPRPRL